MVPVDHRTHLAALAVGCASLDFVALLMRAVLRVLIAEAHVSPSFESELAALDGG